MPTTPHKIDEPPISASVLLYYLCVLSPLSSLLSPLPPLSTLSLSLSLLSRLCLLSLLSLLSRLSLLSLSLSLTLQSSTLSFESLRYPPPLCFPLQESSWVDGFADASGKQKQRCSATSGPLGPNPFKRQPSSQHSGKVFGVSVNAV